VYLFPFVQSMPANRKEYIKRTDSLNVTVNRSLKVIAGLAEIEPFTFHIARHTFAYHLKKVVTNIAAIQDSLGHASSRTTEMYLKALDDEHLDTEMQKLYGK
jgi:integrase